MNAAEELADAGRSNLIAQLSQTLNLPTVDSATWACLWFSDLQKLSAMVDSARGPGAGDVRAMLTSVGNAAMLKAWRPDPEEGHDEWLSDPAKMSWINKLDAGEIYPYSLDNNEDEKSQATPWSGLENFWTPEHVSTWRDAVETHGESCANLITLTMKCVYLWQRARYAMKPLELSDDQKRLDVQFLWLPAGKFTMEMAMVSRPCLPNDLDSAPRNINIFREETQLYSGVVFGLSTHDPEGLPLPSVELLEMQWVLHRVVALSGVVDVSDREIERAFA